MSKHPKKINATVTLTFSDSKAAEAVFYALNPETKSLTTSRASTSIKKEGCEISLTFNACDVVALRVAMNSYIKWVASTHHLAKIVLALKRETSNP